MIYQTLGKICFAAAAHQLCFSAGRCCFFFFIFIYKTTANWGWMIPHSRSDSNVCQTARRWFKILKGVEDSGALMADSKHEELDIGRDYCIKKFSIIKSPFQFITHLDLMVIISSQPVFFFKTIFKHICCLLLFIFIFTLHIKYLGQFNQQQGVFHSVSEEKRTTWHLLTRVIDCNRVLVDTPAQR